MYLRRRNWNPKRMACRFKYGGNKNGVNLMAESRRPINPDLAGLFAIEAELHGGQYARCSKAEPEVNDLLVEIRASMAQLGQTMEPAAWPRRHGCARHSGRRLFSQRPEDYRQGIL
jgi:hypothetical protein